MAAFEARVVCYSARIVYAAVFHLVLSLSVCCLISLHCCDLLSLRDVSSLRRGNANFICIVQCLTDDPQRESFCCYLFCV